MALHLINKKIGLLVCQVNLLICVAPGCQMVHDTTERDFTAERLQPGHTYRVRVSGVSVGGQSEVSIRYAAGASCIC